MGGNYPPGVSASHPYFNPPDHSHDHEWEGYRNGEDLVFEDGAALFHQDCRYAEGRYGEGWQCEESRWIRCDITSIRVSNSGKNAFTLYPEAFEIADGLVEDAMIAVETDSDRELQEVHPPGRDEYAAVVVQSGKYTVTYETEEC